MRVGENLPITGFSSLPPPSLPSRHCRRRLCLAAAVTSVSPLPLPSCHCRCRLAAPAAAMPRLRRRRRFRLAALSLPSRHNRTASFVSPLLSSPGSCSATSILPPLLSRSPCCRHCHSRHCHVATVAAVYLQLPPSQAHATAAAVIFAAVLSLLSLPSCRLATAAESSLRLCRHCCHRCRFAAALSSLTPRQVRSAPVAVVSSLPSLLRLKATLFIYVKKFAPFPLLPSCRCRCHLVASVATASPSCRCR